MSDAALENLKKKRDWKLNSSAFSNLLAWLDTGTNSKGVRYLEMRRRLVAYFDRKACQTPDELADETLNRVARRLEEERNIESDAPAQYCYTTARFVFLEYLREMNRSNAALEQLQRVENSPEALLSEAANEKERRLKCLDQCASKLEPTQREIITRYYIGQERIKIENRRSLADTLGITMNALSIRACRIRDKLEACVRNCLDR